MGPLERGRPIPGLVASVAVRFRQGPLVMSLVGARGHIRGLVLRGVAPRERMPIIRVTGGRDRHLPRTERSD
jgi:hypothetical protein